MKPLLRLNPDLLKKWGVDPQEITEHESVRMFTVLPRPVKSNRHFAEIVLRDTVDGKRVRVRVGLEKEGDGDSTRYYPRIRASVRGYLHPEFTGSEKITALWLVECLRKIVKSTPTGRWRSPTEAKWPLYLKASVDGMKRSLRRRLSRISTKTILKHVKPKTTLDVVDIHGITIAVERRESEEVTDGYVFLRVPQTPPDSSRDPKTPEGAVTFLTNPPDGWGKAYRQAEDTLLEACRGKQPSLARAAKAYRRAVKILKSVPTEVIVMEGRFRYRRYYDLNPNIKRWATYNPDTGKWRIYDRGHSSNPRGADILPLELEESNRIHTPTLYGYLLFRCLCATGFPITPDLIPPSPPDPLASKISVICYASAISAQSLSEMTNEPAVGYLLTGDASILRVLKGCVLSANSLPRSGWYKIAIRNLLDSRYRVRAVKLRAALTPIADPSDSFWNPIHALEVYDIDELPEKMVERIHRALGTVT